MLCLLPDKIFDTAGQTKYSEAADAAFAARRIREFGTTSNRKNCGRSACFSPAGRELRRVASPEISARVHYRPAKAPADSTERLRPIVLTFGERKPALRAAGGTVPGRLHSPSHLATAIRVRRLAPWQPLPPGSTQPRATDSFASTTHTGWRFGSSPCPGRVRLPRAQRLLPLRAHSASMRPR